ncbi:MAG TPA: ATP-binding protein [Jatrophihabitantaceae bacterium]
MDALDPRLGHADNLARDLRSLPVGGETTIETELRTSEKVLARVTDGIYRRPGSALRELISNAYDADARTVSIRTDRPRFDRIVVSDDGLGMSPEVLQHLLHNIGGSAKRSRTGITLGVTAAEDQDLSPGGRRLIGKIGIGLFSVAQLTQAFQISTKVRGDDFQTVASVLLSQYSDASVEDEDGMYRTGKVLLWRESAPDPDAQGTTITLTAIRPQTKETLRSDELWNRVLAAEAGDGQKMQRPLFHIGRVVDADPSQRTELGSRFERLPWTLNVGPDQAFHEFAEAPARAIHEGRQNPRVSNLFDNHLAMLWSLSLSAPLPYVDKGPFDLTRSDARFFEITGISGSEAREITPSTEEPLRQSYEYASLSDVPSDFRVMVDELSVKRPITFKSAVSTSAAFQQPLLFVGHYRTEFPRYDVEFTGGPLEFTAYILWLPKLVPGDHSGVLIRVNGASGTLFDPDFLGFPVNEQTRLSQMMCEVFVSTGLDGALNIDRESINETHPHMVALTRWLHGSLRQAIAAQKRLGAAAAAARRQETEAGTEARAAQIVRRVWADRGSGESPPTVAVTSFAADKSQADYVISDAAIGTVAGRNYAARRTQREQLIVSITQVLAAFEEFTDLEDQAREKLVSALYALVEEYLP